MTGAGTAVRGGLLLSMSDAHADSSATISAPATGRTALAPRSCGMRVFLGILGVARRRVRRPIARRGLDRHHDAEVRTSEFAIDELHAAAMRVHEFEHDRKTDARA